MVLDTIDISCELDEGKSIVASTMGSNILIADDHPLFREALSYIASSLLSECRIIEATNYNETLELAKSESFKLMFVDLNMPDAQGLTDLVMLKKLAPSTPIIIVSAHEEPEIIRQCMTNNASGYIVKSAQPEEMKEAIKKVLAGESYLPNNIDLPDTEDAGDEIAAKISSLTPSQLRILTEIGKGKLNKQIAYDLEISEATVKAHITNVFKKLGINNRTQAVLYTAEHKARLPELKH